MPGCLLWSIVDLESVTAFAGGSQVKTVTFLGTSSPKWGICRYRVMNKQTNEQRNKQTNVFGMITG